ncbi:Predicted nuclease of the RNAse H fold, HicB family [Nakamurella panacisegetis]|uniref:Predicted nuclease of the RNAse H fold, HicB family n=1 Tax=Nakamurella panacisegetis TaxID=1090615 RepID=A0A1H0SJX6_9ACTN|nr:toxin-antitoxin system HicB family antitoxin [Nakamurella panacisegetis]SDP41538.1 Predicted nuclease of the RNAse H fold, HicB family [Nakamurella panacisegetis]
MDLNQYIRNLREDLLAAAALGDEETRRAAALLGAAIEPAGRLAIMNALSDLAAEVTEALDKNVVEVKLDGRDVRVTVSAKAGAFADDTDDTEHDGRFAAHLHAEELRRAMQEAGGELSRTTVRLFNDLKSQAEQAASEQGVSLNTYISRAVSDSVRTAMPPGVKGRKPRGPGGRTVTGFIKG